MYPLTFVIYACFACLVLGISAGMGIHLVVDYAELACYRRVARRKGK